ncbi:MAG: hypothetical protein K2H41_10765 [Acetatifactor sp.]|nr:hypothetical protein [Acetatifactor sp.]
MRKFTNPFPEICTKYALQFDIASDNSDVKLVRKLIDEVEAFLKNHTDAVYAPLYYCLGTSYGNLRTHGYSISGATEASILSSDEIDASLEREIFYFRHCLELLDTFELSKEEFKPYIKGLRLQVYTNYANALENCGRKAAAMKYYRSVLSINPSFGMAEGNIGRALQHYSALIHDLGHKDYLHHFAYRYLKSSLNRTDVHESAKKYFEMCVNAYSTEIRESFLEKQLEIPEYSLGEIEEETYRKWCLHHHLFLNPLNDLPQELSCFATDSLQLPDMVTSIEQVEPPKYYGMFNQLKQEYIYARYLCYAASTEGEETHFADKETHLINMFDYPQYSIRVEGLKTAFRQLYSLFDKVAFLVNDYWELGIHERDINYRTIWLKGYGSGKKYYKYNNVLVLDNNVALKSMFWIHNEFNKKFGEANSPYAKNMQILRNALEHKFVKVHADILWDGKENQELGQDSFYHITESVLLQHTMDLLEIVREWLIDLTMAIHIEEKKRSENYNETAVATMPLIEFEDEWKK